MGASAKSKYSEEAIQFYLTIKSLSNLALRKALGRAQSLLELAGLDCHVPDFNKVSRRQKILAVTIGAHAVTTGLHLPVDSTGIKDAGRRRMEDQEAWRRLPSSMAQGSLGH